MDVENRVVDYLNGDCSDAEQAELFEWIRSSSENAKLFAQMSLMHGQMRSLLAGQRDAQESGFFDKDFVNQARDIEVEDKPKITPQKENSVVKIRQSLFATLLAVAAVVAIGVGIWIFQSEKKHSSNESIAFATIQQMSDVVWGDSTFLLNDRIGKQTLNLVSGIALIRFDSGVEVTLEGPATFDIESENDTRLINGVLVANVPAGAEGFQVDTPSATVVDLGTAFGVNVESEGASEVSVFDGEVEIQSKQDETPHRLLEGESIRLEKNGRRQSVDFNARRFDRIWRLSSGVAKTSGACEFVPPWPRRIRMVSTEEKAFLIPENFSIRLGDPINVNISEAGEYVAEEQLTPAKLESGESIRSYLLHYFPDEAVGKRRAKTVTGSVTFDSSVRGIIVLRNELVASSHLSRLLAGEAQPRRQLELAGQNGEDKIRLSEDRRTIEFELSAPGRSADLIRIIVDAKNEHPTRIRAKGNRKKKRKGKRF